MPPARDWDPNNPPPGINPPPPPAVRPKRMPRLVPREFDHPPPGWWPKSLPRPPAPGQLPKFVPPPTPPSVPKPAVPDAQPGLNHPPNPFLPMPMGPGPAMYPFPPPIPPFFWPPPFSMHPSPGANFAPPHAPGSMPGCAAAPTVPQQAQVLVLEKIPQSRKQHAMPCHAMPPTTTHASMYMHVVSQVACAHA